MNKIGKPVDPTEWGMTPQTVNAYYNPNRNEIVFPAGILQPPFFNMDADDAVNYGAIGMVIGHEMTHGFDNMGRQFDKDGNLRDWWTKEDSKAFNEHTKMLVDQYNKYEVLDSTFVNGQLTLGENIADLGGITSG
jgi:putative endopeptidase